MNTLFNNNTLCGFPYLFFRLILLFANFFSLIYVSDFYPPNRIDLVNVSKFTYSNVAWLGYGFLLLGVVDCFFEGYALMFWTIGFGGLHILYGILFYLQYERSK